MKPREYTIVLTSCNRFDLLQKTLTSLFSHLDIAPKEFILVEDSGNTQIYDVVAKFEQPIRVILNPQNLGQIKSIDLAYSQVTTPYIFHCEDDWTFIRSGFIQESFQLLEKLPHASLIQLRGRAENPVLGNLPLKVSLDISYFLATKKLDKRYFGYSFNPSMRRLSDYQLVQPFQRIGNERQISWVFKQLNFLTAHLENPAVTHLGDQRHIESPCKPKLSLKKQLILLKNVYRRTKWRLFGFPKNSISL